MTMSDCRILIVDDERQNQLLLTRALRLQGYQSMVAENGRQALDLLESDQGTMIDVVLLDIMMPEMNGYDTLAIMKQNESLRHIPVIVISAVEDIESVLSCIEMGAADYLPKPFNAALLQARIKASLAEKQIRDLEQAHFREVQAYLKQIEEEQEKSERLLLNILPQPIADRLKKSPSIIADSYNDVTVLFADLVDFTPFSSSKPPNEVVSFLDEIFSHFDRLVDRYGLEKIKTIGDSYMAVAGLPTPRVDHAEAAADLAIEMQSVMAKIGGTFHPPIQIRIGLHAGPVVAGVVGKKKFIYDLWGDTVNIASRMESHGIPGKIQVSDNFYQRLCKRYIFHEKGVIHVKGKGNMLTHFLIEKIQDESVKAQQQTSLER